MARQETSHQQVMSYWIGGGDYYSSHNFSLLRYSDFDKFVQKEMDTDLMDHGKTMSPDVDNDDEEMDNELKIQIKSGKIEYTSDSIIDYTLRSEKEEFENLSLWEYTASVLKFCKKSEDI